MGVMWTLIKQNMNNEFWNLKSIAYIPSEAIDNHGYQNKIRSMCK